MRPAFTGRRPPAPPTPPRVTLPIASVSRPDDRFHCRPYSATITASACVARQETACTSKQPLPAHTRLCVSCGDGAEIRLRLGGPPPVGPSPSSPVEEDGPTLDQDAESLSVIERLDALEKRTLQNTMVVLDSIDELRRILKGHIEEVAVRHDEMARRISSHVAVGRPGVVAELLFEALSSEPTTFSDLADRTGMRKDVLKNALARLQKQGRALQAKGGWCRGPSDK